MSKESQEVCLFGVGALCFVIAGWLLIKGFRAAWADPKPPKPMVAFVCPQYVTIKSVGPYIVPGWQTPGRHDVTTTQGSTYIWSMATHDNPPYPNQKVCITELN